MRISALVLLVVVGAGADAVASPAPAMSDPLPPPRASSCSESFADVVDVTLDPPAANRLFNRVQHAADAGCAGRLADWLAASRCTSNATGVVAAAAFSSTAFRAEDMSALVTRSVVDAEAGDVACAHQVLPAVQQAARVDAGTRAALSRAARSNDATMSEAGWFVLGTAAHIARANGDELAESIDAELGAALAGATSPTARVMLLEAAGNAGCVSCSAAITAGLADPDPWVRRTAVGATRFLPEGARAMCAARNDPNATVRDQANWALDLTETDCEKN